MVSLQFRASIIIWEGFPFFVAPERRRGYLADHSLVLAYTDWDQAKINLEAKKNSSLWPLQAGSTVILVFSSLCRAEHEPEELQ